MLESLIEKSGNNLWYKTWKKEMENVSVAFEFKHHGYKPPPGWIETSRHLIWDVKMDFTRIARWVKDRHKTADIVLSSFAGVVSWENVRIALTYAALNDLGVIAADIQNAYLQSTIIRAPLCCLW